LMPHLGRWASPDPLQIHAGGGGEFGNSYHYVSGNLLQARDPMGFGPEDWGEERSMSAPEAGCDADSQSCGEHAPRSQMTRQAGNRLDGRMRAEASQSRAALEGEQRRREARGEGANAEVWGADGTQRSVQAEEAAALSSRVAGIQNMQGPFGAFFYLYAWATGEDAATAEQYAAGGSVLDVGVTGNAHQMRSGASGNSRRGHVRNRGAAQSQARADLRAFRRGRASVNGRRVRVPPSLETDVYKFDPRTRVLTFKSEALRALAPDGVQYNAQGYPNLMPFAVVLPNGRRSVRLTEGLSADRDANMRAANRRAFGRSTLPPEMRGKFTWHEHEDGRTMILMPTEVHDAVPHTGGVAGARDNE
jgi:hypothetical protein